MDTSLENLMDTGYVPTFIDPAKYERIHEEMKRDTNDFCNRLFAQHDAERGPEQEPMLLRLDIDTVRALSGRPVSSMDVPLGEKVLLTVEEAAALTGLGENKIRKISEGDKCPFVLWNGSKRMLKREGLVRYLNNADHSI